MLETSELLQDEVRAIVAPTVNWFNSERSCVLSRNGTDKPVVPTLQQGTVVLFDEHVIPQTGDAFSFQCIENIRNRDVR